MLLDTTEVSFSIAFDIVFSNIKTKPEQQISDSTWKSDFFTALTIIHLNIVKNGEITCHDVGRGKMYRNGEMSPSGGEVNRSAIIKYKLNN